jgi:hypothetical protein
LATSDDFRRIALAFPGVEEKEHMSHPDFRVGGKIFATLGSPNAEWGMVALVPEQQEMAMAEEAGAFMPASGAWGRGGSTLVRLDRVPDSWLERTLDWAWQNKAPARLRGLTGETGEG